MNDIRIVNLSFAYNGEDSFILENLSIDVQAGEFVCILGQSGCGKSTLLRLLAGLEQPTSGTISVAGKPIKGASINRSVVFQDYGLFPWKTAGENILLALRQKYPLEKKKKLTSIAYEVLENVGLSQSVFKKYPKELSGGMKQRCAIARSFAIDPPILLMDEPFGALDAVTRVKLQAMILELWSKEQKRKTVIFVTHDVDEALLLANHSIVLGQSPSKVIFDTKIKDSQKANQETLYTNDSVIAMRHALIRHINSDIIKKV